MKKFIKSFLSVVTVICLLISVFTFNVSAASVSVSGGGEYEVGKTFSVNVSFSADATLYAVEADISYNSSVLRLNSVSGADYNVSNGTIKIVDDGFSATKPSKSSSYTLSFTAIAAGNSNISASLLGGGEAESKASGSAAISVVTPKPSSNANLTSIKLSNGSLSPAFNANTTTYNTTVKYSVDSINITGSVADGSATYTGGGTFALQVGDNQRVLTVTAADGTKKSYTINIKRMSEQETAEAEQAERDANPLLVVINDIDYYIVNDLSGVSIPAGFAQGTATRKENEIAVLNDENGKYVLYWLTDAAGENGAFYTCDEDDNFTLVNYVNANGKMYIIEHPDSDQILPSGYLKTKCMIDGNEVDAIGYENEKLKDFYILNCYVGGQTAYYQFDSAEGTMQRAAEFDLAVLAAAEAPEEPDGILDWFKNMNTTGKAVFLIIVVAAIALFVLAILFIVKIATSNRVDFEEYDTMQNTDDNFILNDFADDISSEESPVQNEDTKNIEETSDETSTETNDEHKD